ncbi:T9SS type A sorting domain-containing protein [Hymenobacter cellulosivorans]|uniref:T9SS type A sorting domain-containing protein n=1 Tax=Hymenobacter cellulosivorans TaxID=2932249 RepID=A0ABY4F9Z8_9BACT|nr:T9SS type A sorting domain-containing protein [Hymenobacter cellulosivorans]UOQ53284.1 T9SS type A sorting domain-containing protein [Hymenobacter cellulosivorans]
MKHSYLITGALAVCLALQTGTSRAQTAASSPYVTVAGTVSPDRYACSLGLRADGTLWSWGVNQAGQLGYNTSGGLGAYPTPQQIITPATATPGTVWTHFTIATNAVFALRSDGSLWAWGDIFGHGPTGAYGSLPRLISPPSTAAPGTVWTQLSAGSRHMLALRSDHSLWTWGGPTYTANGINQYSNVPVPVPTPASAAPGTYWTHISAGDEYSMALRSDGTLWGWGNNYYGVLGVYQNQGAFKDLPPTQVPDPPTAAAGTTWTYVKAGNFLTAALRSDGSLWTWGGTNVYEPLKQIPIPSTAPASARWMAITVGDDCYGALLSDSTLWTWGGNSHGQLGIGVTTFQTNPIQEYRRSHWSTVAMGNQFSLAIDSKGDIYGTGFNGLGALGDGTTQTNRLVFTRSLSPLLAAAPPRTLPAPQASPNPAHDYLSVPGLAPTATLRLHDAQGRLVREARPVAGRLDVRGLSPGLYLLTVQEPGQASRAARVVLE